MPTLVLVDGFEHGVASLNSFSGTFNGLWGIAADGTVTFPAGRTGLCMQCSPAAAACRRFKQINPAAVLVTSIYFKVVTMPSVDSSILAVQTAGFSVCPRITLRAATGKLFMQPGSQETGFSVNDGAWHRLDIKSDLSANPWVIDWKVDGVAQTAGSSASAATTVAQIEIGTGAADTYTVQYDDLICSATLADYPLDHLEVRSAVPTGDGTHVAGTNVIEDNAGTDIVSPNAFPLLDEWPANTSDYVQQVAIGGSNYAEVTFPDVAAGYDILGVEAVAALFASGLNANSGTTRIVDSAGTTLTDVYAGDMSETALHYRREIVAVPGGGAWDKTKFDGLKARVGFASDVTDVPRWSALMLQYAVAVAVAPKIPKHIVVKSQAVHRASRW